MTSATLHARVQIVVGPPSVHRLGAAQKNVAFLKVLKVVVFDLLREPCDPLADCEITKLHNINLGKERVEFILLKLVFGHLGTAYGYESIGEQSEHLEKGL